MHSQGIGISHGTIPKTNRTEVCRPSGLYCHGSCFVHELPPAMQQYMELVVNRTRAARLGMASVQYEHSFISTETNASSKYPDSWITDAAGHQVP